MEKTQTNTIRVFPVYDGVAFPTEVYTVEILGKGKNGTLRISNPFHPESSTHSCYKSIEEVPRAVRYWEMDCWVIAK